MFDSRQRLCAEFFFISWNFSNIFKGIGWQRFWLRSKG